MNEPWLPRHRHHRRREPARFRQHALRFRRDPQPALYRQPAPRRRRPRACHASFASSKCKGYRVHGADDVAPELWPERERPRRQGAVGRRTGPTSTWPFRVVSALGRLDVGQAAVVAKGHVLAVEAAEGTDAMLARCAELRQSGQRASSGCRAGVLVKAPKPRAGGARRPADASAPRR